MINLLVLLLMVVGVPFTSGSPEGHVGTRAQLDTIKVVLVGDSTVAVQGGWGPGFCAHLMRAAQCSDLAVNGRSTKSYLDEGLWKRALEAHGQYYLIQFGHNDQKPLQALHTDPQTTFKENLKRYIRDTRAIGGVPILVTPITRRNFKDEHLIIDPLQEYALAVRQTADQMHVPLIDLYKLSRVFLEPLGQVGADRFDAGGNADAKAEGETGAPPDRTHLNSDGQQVFGTMVAEAVRRTVPALRPYLTFTPAAPSATDHDLSFGSASQDGVEYAGSKHPGHSFRITAWR